MYKPVSLVALTCRGFIKLYITVHNEAVWQQETADGDQMGDKRLSLRGVVRVTLADGEVNTQRELPHTQRNCQGSDLLVLDLSLRDVPSARGNECSSL